MLYRRYTIVMVTTTVTVKFHQPTRERRREWQKAMRLYRDTKQYVIDGWENGNFGMSVTTSEIDNELYAAIQNQAIREAKSDYKRDGIVEYHQSQPFAVNNQNWEVDTTDNGNVVIGFPCMSGWWYTPVEVYDEVDEAVQKLIDGEADKSRLQVYRRGSEWYATFNVEHEQDVGGETPVGVDVGHNHVLAVRVPDEDESMLVSGKEAKYVRRKYRSLRHSLQQAGALRARNRVGNKEQRRIKDMNHKLSRQLVEFASKFENAVIRMEDLEGIRDGNGWDGVHSWHFYQLQEFVTYKAEKEGIEVEKVDPNNTSQTCSECGEDEDTVRDGDHFVCHECGYERHADLNAANNIARREGETCSA